MEKFLFKNKNDLLFYIIGISSIFGFIENIIPKPLFFIKIGFSNIPFLLILDIINLRELFIVLFLKSLISAFFSGTLFTPTFLLSLSGAFGTTFGFLILFIFSKILNYLSLFIKKRNSKDLKIKITDIFSLITISIFLSFFSNLFQLFFYAFFLIKDLAAFSILFLITLLSILSGFFTGYIAFKLKKLVFFIIEFSGEINDKRI